MRFQNETSGVVWTRPLIRGVNQKVHDPMSKRARKGKFAYFAHYAVTGFLHRKIYITRYMYNKSIYAHVSIKYVGKIFLRVRLEEK